MPEGVPEWLPGAMMAAGVALVTMWTLARLRARYKRRQARGIVPTAFTKPGQRTPFTPGMRQKSNQDSETNGTAPAGDPSTTRTELHALMVDVQEVTRQCAAQIENRAAMLDRLIADADRKINHLENLLRENSRQQAMGGGPEHSQVSIPHQQPNNHQAPPTKQPPAHTANVDDPLSRRVLEMASRGHSPMHIASVLNEQVGKVQLILALNAPAPTANTGSG